MKKLKSITETCKELYNNRGPSAVYDFANKLIADGNTDIKYEYCKGCDAETPHLFGDCLICGQ